MGEGKQENFARQNEQKGMGHPTCLYGVTMCHPQYINSSRIDKRFYVTTYIYVLQSLESGFWLDIASLLRSE